MTDGSSKAIVTTIGLAVHSVADGAALGASLYRKWFLISKLFLVDQFTDSSLGLLIFAAIMCHKAPASIGFGTFL